MPRPGKSAGSRQGSRLAPQHFMAQPRKKHFEEPVDAEHSSVTQFEFSRKPPSSEDEYFLAKETQSRQIGEPRPEERRNVPLTQPPLPKGPADHPNSIWQRITRILSRWGDPRWRP